MTPKHISWGAVVPREIWSVPLRSDRFRAGDDGSARHSSVPLRCCCLPNSWFCLRHLVFLNHAFNRAADVAVAYAVLVISRGIALVSSEERVLGALGMKHARSFSPCAFFAVRDAHTVQPRINRAKVELVTVRSGAVFGVALVALVDCDALEAFRIRGARTECCLATPSAKPNLDVDHVVLAWLLR